MGFFPEEDVKNEGAGEPWDKEERDKALDEYFAGGHPKKIGIKYKGAPKAFLNSILNKLRYNFKKEGREDKPGRAERYEPVQRTSRKGKKLSPNEVDLIRCHQKLGILPEVTARILCRPVDEFTQTKSDEISTNRRMTDLASSLDLIWAHRFLYYIYKTPVISDEAYNQLVQEEIEYGGGGPELEKIKERKGAPPHIVGLANYLVGKVKK